MAIKFSQFNLRTDHTSGMYLVGYDGNQNIHITVDNLFDDFINGTENTIAMFGTGGTALADSILSQDAGATLLTVAGQLNVDAAATFDTSVTVTGDSTLNGNVTLGDASTDLITQTGTLYLNGPVKDTTDTLGAVDQVLLSDATGELTFTDLADLHVGGAEVVEVPVKNAQGSPLAKGDPVYISGSVGASGRLEVQLADASNTLKMPAVGLLKQDLAINEEGFAVVTGKLRNLITDPIDGVTPTENDVIYVKPSGTSGAALTTTKPVYGNFIQNIGKVGRVSTAADGNLVVSSILRTNDIPNLTPGRLWIGSTGNTIESQTLFVDEANGRLGINETNPGYSLDVDGTLQTSGWAYFATSGPSSLAQVGGGSTTTSQFNIISTATGGSFIAATNTLTLKTNNVSAIKINNASAVQFNQYGGGVYTGTAAYNLSVDSSGNVIETAAVPANIVETITTTDGTYINLTPNSPTDGAVTVTADLSATGTADATKYLRGDNTWSPISGIYDWNISDGTNSETIVNGDTVTFSGDTYITTTYTAGNNTLSIDHDDTSRTDTTSTDNPGNSGTFQAVTSVSTNGTGHVTGIDVSTVTLPSAYSWAITADTGLTSTVINGNTVDIAGGTNINTEGKATDTVEINLDDSITLAGTLTVNGTGQSSFAGQVTIPQVPSANTDAASKHYVDQAVTGALSYQGGYNPSTNIPDLTSSPNSILKGWTYTVTADGTFFGEQVRVGDVLIAEIDNPTNLTDWTTVQNNIDLADLNTVGIGNVAAGTNIGVSYSNGTATISNGITNNNQLTNGAGYTSNTGTVTSVAATQGSGISITGSPITTSGTLTISNTDRGSSQNIFKNFAVSGQSTVVADSNNDTLTLVNGSNVNITTNATNDSITINASDTNNYVISASFNTGDGVLTLGRTGLSAVTVDLDGRYLTSYTETDTLATVVARGNSTSNSIYAPSFIDYNNNSYYVDPAGDSQLNTIDIDDYIRHRGDVNTYIGFPSNDTFIVTTANSERVRVTSSGNVGIGTTSPSAKLEVKGSGTSPIVYFGNGVDNAPNRQLAFSGGSSGLIYDLDATGASGVGGQLTLSTNGSERLRIDSSGNVGIGTSSPSTPLEVNVTGNNTVFSLTRDTGTNGELTVDFQNADANFDSLQGGHTFQTGGTERMRINSSGNVGIGTDSPGGLLHVSSGTSGDAIVIIESDTDNSNENDNPHVELRQDGGGIRAKLGIVGDPGSIYSNSLTNATYLGTVFEQSLQFITGNTGGVQTAKMTIQPNSGNVGIGTTSPASKLDVNGGIRMADDSSTASASNVGTLRYRTSGNNSYVDMCMQTGASTYAWVNIVQNSW